ncbi:unnamed protein product [Brassica oleracea]
MCQENNEETTDRRLMMVSGRYGKKIKENILEKIDIKGSLTYRRSGDSER